MKLAIALTFLLGYCVLLVAGPAADQKGGKTKAKAKATPARSPTPRPSPTPAKTPTPAPTPRPSPTPAPMPTTPTPTPSPTATATPTASPSAATPAPSATPSPSVPPQSPPTPGAGVRILSVMNCETVIVLPGIPLCSKTQPKEVSLCSDCNKTPPRDPEEGRIPPARFTHEAHATKNYSVDGNSVIGCVECHHTDERPEALRPPYKTSQRGVTLTTQALGAPGAPPVYACRGCHSVFGARPQLLEALQPNPEPDANLSRTTKDLTNKVAYHKNCIICHDDAKQSTVRTTVPNAPTACTDCHK